MAPALVLTGFMGSGKTRIGRRVGELLGWPFQDLDEEVVKAEGVSIAEIFAAKGEATFRTKECDLLAALLEDTAAGSARVIALGGGTLETPAAAALLKGRHAVVYLEVDAAEAWARMKEGDRPLARDEIQFETLLAKRRATYEDVAGWLIPVRGREAEELAHEIAEIVRSNLSFMAHQWGRRVVSTGRLSFILGGRDALLSLGEPPLIRRAPGSRVFVITDENVERAWGEQVLGILGRDASPRDVFSIDPGEGSKSVASLERCWAWLATRGARRDDTIVALGGGVVGDLAGFAAATYHRGVSLWQIPTSLLSQVDSSVGGKTGINLEEGKNLVGAFYQPDLVVTDPGTLSTLPAYEYVNGLGEVVKYGLLDSGRLFATLEEEGAAIAGRDSDLIGEIVKKCVIYKAGVVEEDERDKGRRAVLNLGHTTAHALEVTLGYGSVSHGRAVALGLLVALSVSETMLELDHSVRERTQRVLESFGLPVVIGIPDIQPLLEAAGRDKKVTAGARGFVGLRAIGEPVWGLDVPNGVMEEALQVIRA